MLVTHPLKIVRFAPQTLTAAEQSQARTNIGAASVADITAINNKIPSDASALNQLADKAFVNSSISTNTANYISDNGQPFSSLAALEAYSGTLTNNDYAFVVGTDTAGNTLYTRYKYNSTTQTWAAEYVLNNSSFTAAQWAAINSTITQGKLDALTDREFLVISSDRSVALAEDSVESAYEYTTSHPGTTAGNTDRGFSVNLKTYLDTFISGATITKVRLRAVTIRLRDSTDTVKLAVSERGTTTVLALSAAITLTNVSGGRDFTFQFSDNVWLDADKKYDFVVVDATTEDPLTSLRFGFVESPQISGIEAISNSGTYIACTGVFAGGMTVDYLALASVRLATHTDLTNHTSNTTIHVTASDKTAWNAKYDLPSTGIPKTDLASGVQASLDKADTALQTAPVTKVNNKTGDVTLTLNDVCPDAENWLGVAGTTAAGKSIKVLAKTVDGVIEGGVTVTASSANDNNTTKYRYGGVTATRNGTATDYLFDTSSQSGIVRRSELTPLAPLASPAFTGTPTAPTPTSGDNSTKVATTAFVKTAVDGISVTPLSGNTYDFSTMQGIFAGVKACIEALGGSVTNFPAIPVNE